MARTLPRGDGKSQQELTPSEAIAAIGAVTIATDGDIADTELEFLAEIILEIEVFEDYSDEEIDEIFDKIANIAQTEGVGVLVETAVDALQNEDLREVALMTAMLIVAADEDILEEEEYLAALQKVLGISSERFGELVDELFGEEE